MVQYRCLRYRRATVALLAMIRITWLTWEPKRCMVFYTGPTAGQLVRDSDAYRLDV